MKPARLITTFRGLRCLVTVFYDSELGLYTVAKRRLSSDAQAFPEKGFPLVTERHITADRADALTQGSQFVKVDNALYLRTKGKSHVA